MPRPTLTVPGAPKVHKGRYRFWWRGRYVDLGRASPASEKKKALAKYSRQCVLLADDPNAVDGVAVGELTMTGLIADFLESADSPRTKHRSRYTGLLKLFGDYQTVAVKDFGPREFRVWVAWVCSLERTVAARGVESRFNRTMVRALMVAVRRVIRWGVSTERVKADHLDALKTVPPPKRGIVRPPRVPTAADPAAVRAVLPHLSPPTRALVELLALTGARPSELLRMRAGEVLRSGKVMVTGVGQVDLDALGIWVYSPVEHKTADSGAARWLVFAGRAKKVLGPWLKGKGPEAFAFDPRAADTRRGRSGYVRAPGAGYAERSLYQAVERACRRAGVDTFTPYQLRRLAAVEIDAAFGREGAAATLGHATISTTAIYTGRNFDLAVRVAKARG
jgi:integrase